MARLLVRSLPWLALVLAGSPVVALADEPAWVFFKDRGRDPQALAQELGTRAAELAPRTLQRRQRVRGDGGVDARDLSPAPGHVAAVLATGARLRHSSRWLNAISVEATPAQRAAIARLATVARVQPVARAKRRPPPALVAPRSAAAPQDLTGPPTSADEEMYGFTWEQLQMLKVPALHDCGLTGEGVVIGVQDSGFSLSHDALAGVKVIATRDFVNNDDNVDEEPGDPEKQYYHGTMVLSTIAGSLPGTYIGAAPGVSVLLSKTEDISVEEPFEEDNYVAGLEWIESMGADLFTASLGYLDWYEPSDMDGKTAVTTIASEIAVAQGLIMFNSIGNAGPEPTTMGAPADAEGIISVGAVDLGGEVTGFSSRGPTADGRLKPNIVAPGLDVVVVNPVLDDQYVTAKGTSFSGPLAAAAGALLIQAFPEISPAELRTMLQDAGNNAGSPDNDVGWGLPDVSLPVTLLCGCSDSDGDGFFAAACGGDDCDDGDSAVFPGAPEICDGQDNDCDQVALPDEVDADDDDVVLCAGDCDDADPDNAPGLEEVCDDGQDNNCDQLVDADDPMCMAATSGESSSGGADTGTGDSGGAEGPSSSGDLPTGPVDPSATDAGSSSSQADPPADEPPVEGCACTGAGPGSPLLLLGPLALLRRRRRGSPRVSMQPQ